MNDEDDDVVWVSAEELEELERAVALAEEQSRDRGWQVPLAWSVPVELELKSEGGRSLQNGGHVVRTLCTEVVSETYLMLYRNHAVASVLHQVHAELCKEDTSQDRSLRGGWEWVEGGLRVRLELLSMVRERVERLGHRMDAPPRRYVDVLHRYVRSLAEPDVKWCTVAARLPDVMKERLRGFQRDGITEGVKRDGRIMLADEMGLGKSVQALGIALFFREDWPLLIMCPASLRDCWLETFHQWVPCECIPSERIILVSSGKDHSILMRAANRRHTRRDPWDVPTSVDVVIVSYDSVAQYLEDLVSLDFNVVIADESHNLKNWETVRFQICSPLIARARRRILISGTPALGRPAELFTQLSLLDPSTFCSFAEFSNRYCPESSHGCKGVRNVDELRTLLSVFMIRRLKKEVEHLPPKCRSFVVVSANPSALRNLSEKKSNLALPTTSAERSGIYRTLHFMTGLAKLPGVVARIDMVLRRDLKTAMIIFASHLPVLDGLESFAHQRGIPTVRIDGSTTVPDRHRRVNDFQTRPHIRLAILSLASCGTGLTLTRADTVLFAELDWTPGLLIQAEDRAHRIGRTHPVQIEYVIAPGTLDDTMWPNLTRKLGFLQQCLDGTSSVPPHSTSPSPLHGPVQATISHLQVQHLLHLDPTPSPTSPQRQTPDPS